MNNLLNGIIKFAYTTYDHSTGVNKAYNPKPTKYPKNIVNESKGKLYTPKVKDTKVVNPSLNSDVHLLGPKIYTPTGYSGMGGGPQYHTELQNPFYL